MTVPIKRGRGRPQKYAIFLSAKEAQHHKEVIKLRREGKIIILG